MLHSTVLGGAGLRVEGSYLRMLTPSGDTVPFDDELADALREAAERREAALREAASQAEAAQRVMEQEC